MGNKFFGSKLNTILLLILIVLMVFALRIMLKDKETYLPVLEKEEIKNNDIPSGDPVIDVDSFELNRINLSWAQSEEFKLNYPSVWQIEEFYIPNSESQNDSQKEDFPFVVVRSNVSSSTIIKWGGSESACTQEQFKDFKYGVSTSGCIRNLKAELDSDIGTDSPIPTFTQDELNVFSEFILKNQ